VSSNDYREKNQVSLKHLGRSVSSTVEKVSQLRSQLELTRQRLEQMEEAIESVKKQDRKPLETLRKLRTLEMDNRDLVDRLDQGRVMLDRLLSKIKFIEGKS
jgi:septation ring formation regulator EzrA